MRVFSLILCLLASLCLYRGLIEPLISFQSFYFWEDKASLLQIVMELWDDQSVLLAVVVGLFSIVLPIVKLIVVGWRVCVGRGGGALFSVLGILSKWAMLDVLIVALVIVATKSSGIAKATVMPGMWFFASAVILTAFAGYCAQKALVTELQ